MWRRSDPGHEREIARIETSRRSQIQAITGAEIADITQPAAEQIFPGFPNAGKPLDYIHYRETKKGTVEVLEPAQALALSGTRKGAEVRRETQLSAAMGVNGQTYLQIAGLLTPETVAPDLDRASAAQVLRVERAVYVEFARKIMARIPDIDHDDLVQQVCLEHSVEPGTTGSYLRPFEETYSDPRFPFPVPFTSQKYDLAIQLLEK